MSTTTDDAQLARELLHLINGSWIAQACYVTARLGIADLLASAPRTAEDLARATDTHAPSLQRLLGALASAGLTRQREDGAFEMTRLGALLRKDAPVSLHAWALKWGGDDWPVWANLLYSIRTGQSARALLTGTPGFAHLERNAETAAVFNRAMAELTHLAALAIARAYDFAGQRVMDVGGGYGELLAQILLAHPSASGVLFDMPHAIARAREQFQRRGLAARCELVSGDFFEAVPAGADVYVLKSVIHDWPDERARVILGSCQRAMQPGARLLVVERLMPERLEATADHQALARSDLHMLVALAAQERTEGQMQSLLRSAGFSRLRRIETDSDFQIVAAEP